MITYLLQLSLLDASVDLFLNSLNLVLQVWQLLDKVGYNILQAKNFLLALHCLNQSELGVKLLFVRF